MGCDIAVHKEHVPYCKPKCKEFKLVAVLENVRAQCVRCSLHHEFTIVDGMIKIVYEKKEG
jgi:hypothetical protein